MAEYIEREAVLKHLRECEGTPPEIGYTYPIFKALECFVEDVPAADVAPVVRCRECKHITPVEGGLPLCTLHNIARAYNDFCSDGARMDGE